MSQWKIREYTGSDIPQLSALWYESFGDSGGFIKGFFELLGGMGSGLAAEVNGKIIGGAYVLDGQCLVTASGEKIPVGYIYGVSVADAFQGHGIGAELSRRACALARERGAEIVCTLPAEDSLYGWYEKIIGVKPALYRSVKELGAEKLLDCRVINAPEYSRLRQALTAGKNHLELSNTAMEFQSLLLRECDGAFLAFEEGICSAYVYDGVAYVRELIAKDGADVEAMAATAAYVLGTERALLYLPSETGEKYIAADRPLPPDCIWNLSFD